MAITINNGIQNISGTPGAASGVFADRPSATNVADGTLFFATDTLAIYQAIAGSWSSYAGGGGLSSADNGLTINPASNVQLGGTLLNDTLITCDDFQFNIDKTKTFTVTSSNGTAFELMDNTIFTVLGTNQFGLNIDFGINIAKIGNYGSGIFLQIDDTNLEILTKNTSGNIEGIYFDFNNNKYALGDYDYTIEGTFLYVDSKNQFIATQNHAVDVGLKLDFNNFIFSLGDYNNVSNYTYLQIDDNAQKLLLSNNLKTTNNGTAVNEHLKVTIGGIDYVIQLRLA